MQPTTPPWRVLDAPGTSPAPDQASPASLPGSGMPGSPADAAGPAAAWATLVISRSTVLASGALAVAAALIVAAFLLAAGTQQGTLEVGAVSASERPASGGRVPSSAVPSAETMVVEVAGAVVRPGVYTLPKGSRVGDAIAAAGGYGPRVAAELASLQLNLAAPLKDGQQVRVPSRDDPSGGGPGVSSDATAAVGAADGGTGGGQAGPLDLNRASATELETLPGIGPATAAKVVASRADRPFTTVDELLERKLVSAKVLEGLRALVTVR